MFRKLTISQNTIDKQYKCIVSKERSLARAIAFSVEKPAPLSVWDVMIPVVFILNYLNLKQARELLTENLFFTKGLALEGTLKMLKHNQSKEMVMSEIKKKTDHIMASDSEGIYSKNIRDCQMEEIELLINHYSKLIKTNAKDYDAMVLRAYERQEEYWVFIKRLEESEKKVSDAAKKTLGEKANTERLAKIEAAAAKVRQAQADKIFKGNPS